MQNQPGISIATISPAAIQDNNNASANITITLIVNDGKISTTRIIESQRGISALEAFQRVAQIGYKKYPFGSYVYSVGGLKENTDNSGKYWQYYVDGRIVMVAVDNYKLNSDAELEFRFEKQNPAIK
ncbi:MAG: DUF4430 domain-containing protein [Candidatus Micrarchaeota archaeon]